MHLFDAQGHAMTESEKVELWKLYGKCTECGEVTTHRKVKTGPFKAFRKMKGITVKGRVYKGYCLKCHDLEDVLRLLGENESNIPSLLKAHMGVIREEERRTTDVEGGGDGVEGGFEDNKRVRGNLVRSMSSNHNLMNEIVKGSPIQVCLRSWKVQACLILTAVALFVSVIVVTMTVTSMQSGGDDDNQQPKKQVPAVGGVTVAPPTTFPTEAPVPTAQPTPAPSRLGWGLVGNEIYSTLSSDNSATVAFGAVISMAEKGHRIAVSDPTIAQDGPYRGTVQVFQYIPDSKGGNIVNGAFAATEADGRWELMGQPIVGEANEDYCGAGMDLSPDGTRLAVGYPGNGNGFVRVYEYGGGINGTSWFQIGQTLPGKQDNERFGDMIALSKDGSTVLVGAPLNSDAGLFAGQARVYRYNITSNVWTQVGQDISGEAEGDEFGSSLDLNYDGKIIAVGSSKNDDRGPESGQIRAYRLLESTGEWEIMHRAIWGDNPGDGWGHVISFDELGDWFASSGMGAEGKDPDKKELVDAGHVRTIDWDSKNGWLQIGFDIDGSEAYAGFGNDLMLSPDAGTLIAAYRNKDGLSGRVRVFEEVGASWIPLGDEIEGEETSGFDWYNQGPSVAVSRWGKRIAVGYEGIKIEGEIRSVVRVLSWRGLKGSR